MKTSNKILSILSITSAFLLTGAIAFSSTSLKNFLVNPLSAISHICYGNHYNMTNPTASESGVKEYWVCCECHEHYLSNKNIPNYDPSKWTDIGTASRLASEFQSDSRYINDIFGSPIIKQDSGFSANASESRFYAGSNDGWILSGNDFYNFSFTFKDTAAGTVDSYGSHDIDNALLLGANYVDGRLTGYALTVSWDYVGLFYLTGDKEDYHHAGDCIIRSWTSQGYAGRMIDVAVIDDTLFVSCEGDLLIQSWLSPVDWDPGLYPHHTYTGGKIGFLNTQKDPEKYLKIYDFALPNNVFNDTKWNSGNDWTVNDDGSSLTSTSNSGYILSNKTYSSFKAVAHVDSTVSDNTYFTHVAYNSFLFGASLNNGNLQGFIIEFNDSFIMLAKLLGDGTFSTDNVLVYIEATKYGVAVANQDVFIELSGTTVNFGIRKTSDYDGSTPRGFYLTQSYDLSSLGYSGGSLGYLGNNSNQHNIVARVA